MARDRWENFLLVSRIQRVAQNRKALAVYMQQAEDRRMLDIAARTWAGGVPWDEAIKIGRDVFKKMKRKDPTRARDSAG